MGDTRSWLVLAFILALCIPLGSGCSIEGCACGQEGHFLRGKQGRTTTTIVETPEEEQKGEHARIEMTIPPNMNAVACVC